MSKSERLFRVRPLSAGGIELFEDTVKRYSRSLLTCTFKIEQLLHECNSSNVHDPELLKTQLSDSLVPYEHRYEEFTEYLRSHRSQESSSELYTQSLAYKDIRDQVSDAFKTLDQLIQKIPVVPKQKSKKSTNSKNRSHSRHSRSVYSEQMRTVETARIKQKYVEKECEFMRQKMEAELSLKQLESKQQLEIAEKQLDEMSDESESVSQSSAGSVRNIAKQRTEEYVDEQRTLNAVISSLNPTQTVKTENVGIHTSDIPHSHSAVNPTYSGSVAHPMPTSSSVSVSHVITPSYGSQNFALPLETVNNSIPISTSTCMPAPTPSFDISHGNIYQYPSLPQFDHNAHSSHNPTVPTATTDHVLNRNQLYFPGMTTYLTYTQPSSSTYMSPHNVPGSSAVFTSYQRTVPQPVSINSSIPVYSPQQHVQPVSTSLGSSIYSPQQHIQPVSASLGSSIYSPPQHVQSGQPSASIYSPPQHANVASDRAAHTEFKLCEELSKFLTKQEFLKHRKYKFDDNPAYFETWKSTFQGMVAELGLSAKDQMELLQTSLGPETSVWARSIYTSHINPEIACEEIWKRLHDTYGRPEELHAKLKERLVNFPKLSEQDSRKLYNLADLASEINAVKQNARHAAQFARFDSSDGLSEFVVKLPFSLRNKWISQATKYKNRNNSVHPPFSVFVTFLFEMAKMKNDPSFKYYDVQRKPSTPSTGNRPFREPLVKAKKTGSPSNELGKANEKHDLICPLHETKHSLNSCRAFRSKPMEERIKFLLSKGLCKKCCGQNPHFARNCHRTVYCAICKSSSHPTALHVDQRQLQQKEDNSRSTEHAPQSKDTSEQINVKAASACTSVCGDIRGTSKSCSKTLLVRVYSEDQPERSLTLYAIIDDQSDCTLAKSAFFDFFGINSPEIVYSLSSCSGVFKQSGRETSGLIIEAVDGSYNTKLPNIIECEHIPNAREEIPTRQVAERHPHLENIAHKIPPLDNQADILLLIGRDLLSAHHVLEQRLGPDKSPFAQRLRLGWVVIGEVCHKTFHGSSALSVSKTFILMDGRPSNFEPCQSQLRLRKDNADIFIKTSIDDTPGLSIEDTEFIASMESGITKDNDGCWSVPLPFKKDRQRLPSNKTLALKRANLFTKSLLKNPEKKQHVIEFMANILDRNHAELAPPLEEHQEHWFLPLFAVYHPKKPNKVRCVFDSSAKHQGVSLNDILLTGPDMLNSLLGILMRFRQRPVAISADIEQMFYRFSVPPSDRDYLRFYWHQDNDVNKPLVEYRMKRHVFGNSSSPGIAAFGLRETVKEADAEVKHFIEENFYVDDGLISLDQTEEAIRLLKRTQNELLTQGNIRLHKIASNDTNVLKAFPTDDLAIDIASVNLELSETSPQRSLGVSWDIAQDVFTFHVSKDIQPSTKRGILSTVNSLYDPFGFLAPVTVKGKLIMRNVMSLGLDWDDPLPPEHGRQWHEWRETLPLLEEVTVTRTYANIPSSLISHRELHIFSDASQHVIAAVAYMKLYDVNGNVYISFVQGKTKVAPRHGHTIPRLELCAALLATQLKDNIVRCLDDDYKVTMYTDSKIVLGYICNEQRRFYVYVSNRVSAIRHSTTPSQWTYISSEMNPADIGTRTLSSDNMKDSVWLKGPSFLSTESPQPSLEEFPLVEPDSDNEIREVVALKTRTSLPSNGLDVERFKTFSSWSRLVSVIAKLQLFARSLKSDSRKGWNDISLDANNRTEAEKFIFREVQKDSFRNEICSLTGGSPVPVSSSVSSLNPYLDSDGIMRVGGRLSKAKDLLKDIVTNPIILPKNSHVALLLTRHYHSLIHHQGQRMTEGKLRSVGYWIVGAKRMVNSVIRQCIVCRKLRGQFCSPKMSDLPSDRLTPGPPFTFVGLDTFGPWNVVSRKTRGGLALNKRWAILFTCLTSRAVHIEVVHELSTPSFINALRRFLAIRGPVRMFRSDRGTNFTGAVRELNILSKFVEEQPVTDFLNSNRCTWEFNSPHASHFGGAWERMIGLSRKILDSMLLKHRTKELTDEVLSTFFAEVCAIINSRPLTPLTSDPSDPLVLTPTMLLTQKVGQLPDIIPELSTREMHKSQWHHVQILANEFWRKWQKEYLCQLQKRQKWTQDKPNVNVGDLVLLREYDLHRNQWPMAIVTRIFPASDSCVREVEIRLTRDGKSLTYIRPVHELIRLLD